MNRTSQVFHNQEQYVCFEYLYIDSCHYVQVACKVIGCSCAIHRLIHVNLIKNKVTFIFYIPAIMIMLAFILFRQFYITVIIWGLRSCHPLCHVMFHISFLVSCLLRWGFISIAHILKACWYSTTIIIDHFISKLDLE